MSGSDYNRPESNAPVSSNALPDLSFPQSGSIADAIYELASVLREGIREGIGVNVHLQFGTENVTEKYGALKLWLECPDIRRIGDELSELVASVDFLTGAGSQGTGDP